ncbi:MAG: TRAP transporter large permease, partial [Deltaproteobacteria bacterium]
MSAWLLVGIALLLLLLGVPLFVVIGAVTFLAVLTVEGGVTGITWSFFQDNEDLLAGIIADMFEAVSKEVLLAIPFFVLAGGIMTAGGISNRLIAVAKAAIGWVPGGLAVSAVISCAFFAAISGSSPVTVIAIGTILFPALVSEGYPKRFSMGLLTTSGSLGILIPPSIPMILYAIMVSSPRNRVSVTDLFIAGILPGLLITLLLSGYAILHETLRASRGESSVRTPFSWKRFARSLREGIWSLLLPVLIMGGIYSGFFTATESAAVAVVYALVVEVFIHREVRIADLPKICIESALLMGTLFPILVIAIALNRFLTIEQIPQAGAELIGGIVQSRWAFLLVVNLFLLALGCLMDIISAILIVAPILATMAGSFGIDPIHFG